jgi:S-DNA-T family DNA segregation ATPase FtsK/SpoIIIE
MIVLPLGPLGRWTGKQLVSGVSFLKSAIGRLLRRVTSRDEVDPYFRSARSQDEDNLHYYEYAGEPSRADTSVQAEPEAKQKDAPVAEASTRTFSEASTSEPRAQKPRETPRPGPKMPTEHGMPSLDLLVTPPHRASSVDEAQLLQRAEHLMQILSEFGVKGRITHVRPGPVVTLFELEPAAGVKSARVISLADDVARSMSATSARIAVVPGKNAIGIELPNKGRETVYLRTLLESPSFAGNKQALPLALGEDIGGEPVCADLAKMPHLLIAGTTGSGKSVGINAMILSLMYKLPPEKCRFIMVDPKMLELSIYEGVPHLLSPVVVDPKKAVTALKWAVREMESRYEMMSKAGVRNLVGFNEKVDELKRTGGRLTKEVQTGYEADTGRPVFETENIPLDQIPNIVIVIDEMADLMMVAGKEIEACIQRLAQMARAAGIHLITATQRPSVDVITGTIKANFPTRISYMVSSKIDSRTILNEQGAEQLLGMGDLLYMASGGKVKRLHGPFVSDEEVGDIVNFLKSTGEPDYKSDITEEPDDVADSPVMDAILGGNDEEDLYSKAVAIVLKDKRASTSYVQRRLGIGYNRAASIIERMETEGIVSAPNHSGRREILRKGSGED